MTDPLPLSEPNIRYIRRRRGEGVSFVNNADAVIDRLLATLDRDRERLAALEGAAMRAELILEAQSRQAMNPGPDHLVVVTAEAWMDVILPILHALRAALKGATS